MGLGMSTSSAASDGHRLDSQYPGASRHAIAAPASEPPLQLSPAQRTSILHAFRQAARRELAVASEGALQSPPHGDLDVALLEHEVYGIIELLGLAAPRRFMLSADELDTGEVKVADIARRIHDRIGAPSRLFLKVQATGLLHKTEAGAIRRVEADPHAVLEAARQLLQTVRRHDEGGRVVGVLVVEAVEIAETAGVPVELLLGGRQTRDFGPVVMLSAGGVAAEFWNARLQKSHGPILLGAEGGVTPAAALDAVLAMTPADLTFGRFRNQPPLSDPELLAHWVQAWAALLDGFSGRGAAEPADATIIEAEINPLVIRGGGGAAIVATTATVDGEPRRGQPVPLDGLLRVRVNLDAEVGTTDGGGDGRGIPTAAGEGVAPLTEHQRVDALAAMLRPRTVAVAGVSGSRVNSGRVILRNLLSGKFSPDRLAVIKPGAGAGDEIDGVGCYASIADVPFDRVDLYVVAVDAATTVAMLAEARGKVAGALLIAGGTSEREEGVDLGRRLGQLLDETGVVAVGPNSLGIIARPAGLDTLFIPESKLPRSTRPAAPVAYISQSGAFMITRMNRLPQHEPLYAISTGNQLRSGISEVVEAVARDGDVRVFAVYVEGFSKGDGVRLCRVARRLREEGRIVILYKAGRTAQGAAAASGHTASIAGDAEVCRQLVEQAGVLFAEDFDEFEDLVRLATAWAEHPASRHAWASHSEQMSRPASIALLSNAGYECVGMADHLGWPLVLAELGPAAAQRFRSVLALRHIDAIVDVHNPMDITPMADTDVWVGVVETMLTLGRVEQPAAPVMTTSSGRAAPGAGAGRPESADRLAQAVRDQGQCPIDVLLISIVPPAPTIQTLAPGEGHREDVYGDDQIAARLNRLFATHLQQAEAALGGSGGASSSSSLTRVAFCVDCGPLYDAFADALGKSGLPVFRSSDRAVSAIRRLLACERPRRRRV